MSEITKLPDSIQNIIFEYLHPDHDIFNQISMIYLANLFGFKPVVSYAIINNKVLHEFDSRFRKFKNIQITDFKEGAWFDDYTEVCGTRILHGKDYEEKNREILTGKKPALLTLKHPTPEMIQFYSDLIKDTESIKIITTTNNLDILKEFRHVDTIQLTDKTESTLNLNVQNLEFLAPIFEDELIRKLKGVKNIKYLSFRMQSKYISEHCLCKIIPDSVTSLKIRNLEYLPDFSGLNLVNLEIRNLEIMSITRPDPVFPVTLKSLTIGSIETLFWKGKPVLPKNLEYLSLRIHPEISGLTYEMDGKIFSSFPEVETLVIEFYDITKEDKLTQMIIPKSVKNLMLIDPINLNFDVQKIEFEDPKNLRSLIIKNSFSIYGHEKIKNLVDLGKLESLIITLDYDNADKYEKIMLNISDNLKILCCSQVEIFGSPDNLLYFSTKPSL